MQIAMNVNHSGLLLRLSLFLLLAPMACSHLPAIQPVKDASTYTEEKCTRVYPRGDWQFLHSIEASPPAGDKMTILGLSQLSSATGTLHCVMMTVEGVVLFEAEYNGTIDVQRAIPPFDKPGMAEGIIEDLKLIFLQPQTAEVIVGRLDAGDWACRYVLPDRSVQDITFSDPAHWRIVRYDPRHRPVRTVTPVPAQGVSSQGMANQIVLQAPGLIGYQLKITLLEAEPLSRPKTP